MNRSETAGTVNNPKEEAVQKVRNEINKIADAEGKGIERGIKESVIAFEVTGLHPKLSCEGHTRKGQISAPWVEIADPNRPDERFAGQNAVFQQVAKERGLPFEEVKRSFDSGVYDEAMSRMPEEESSEFQAWEGRNNELLTRAKIVVEEFYQECGEPENESMRIRFDDDFVGGLFRIYSGGKDYAPVERELTQDEEAELRERLIYYRAEMERLSQFLFERYYGK